jgi:hypothetical protein
LSGATVHDEVWDAALEQLATLGEQLVQELVARGESPSAEPLTAVLGAAMDSYLFQLCGDVDFPTFVPCCTWFQHTGSPNPDTVYRRAAIDGAGAYLLTGNRGTAWQATVMPFPVPAMTGKVSFAPYDLAELAADDGGRFEVLLSNERPAGHTGNWWPIDERMGSLWLRSVDPDWRGVTDPRVAIARLDGPAHRPRPSSEWATRRLRAFAPTVERMLRYGLDHADDLAAGGFVNALKAVDYGAAGGMPGQWYDEGLFDLAEDEALVLEAVVPPDCGYFSLSLTDRMLVTLDWTHAQTSLNSVQAEVGGDGLLRVVVSEMDPLVRNWLDTTGYRRGVLQCRWLGSAQRPTVSTSVVRVDQLQDVLPASATRLSVEERADALVERRLAAQMRQLW